MFEHKVFNKMFVHVRNVVGEQLVLCNKELCDLYKSFGMVVVKCVTRRL